MLRIGSGAGVGMWYAVGICFKADARVQAPHLRMAVAAARLKVYKNECILKPDLMLQAMP